MINRLFPFFAQGAGILSNLIFLFISSKYLLESEYASLRLIIVQGGVIAVSSMLGYDNLFMRLEVDGSRMRYLGVLLMFLPLTLLYLIAQGYDIESVCYTCGLFVFLLAIQESRIKSKNMFFFYSLVLPKIIWFSALYMYVNFFEVDMRITIGLALFVVGIPFIQWSAIRIKFDRIIFKAFNGVMPVVLTALVFRSFYFIGNEQLTKEVDLVYSVLLTTLVPFSVIRILSEGGDTKPGYISSFFNKNLFSYSVVVFLLLVSHLIILEFSVTFFDYSFDAILLEYLSLAPFYYVAGLLPNKVFEAFLYFDRLSRPSKARLIVLSAFCLIILSFDLSLSTYYRQVILFMLFLGLNIKKYSLAV